MADTPEPFTTCVSVLEDAAADEALLAEIERRAGDEDWREAVEDAGGRPVGQPVVSRESNPTYGLATPYGVDHVKLYIWARGWAVRALGG